jgi:hypothetical protein
LLQLPRNTVSLSIRRLSLGVNEPAPWSSVMAS